MKKNFDDTNNPAAVLLSGSKPKNLNLETPKIAGDEIQQETGGENLNSQIEKPQIKPTPTISLSKKREAWTILADPELKTKIQIYAIQNKRKDYDCINEAIEDFLTKYSI